MNLRDITPLVLTRDEEPNIGRCLQRLQWAGRVVVLDSLSTDGTEAIALSFGNVLFARRVFDDHTSQWNHGIDLVESAWVLAMDADYVLDDGFELELEKLCLSDGVDACYASFRYVIAGRPLRGSLYPPRAVLFRKASCRYVQDGHTQLLHIPGKAETLTTPILHDDRKPLSRWLRSQDQYARLEAEKLLAADKATLRPQDKLRLSGWAAIPATLIYTLLVRGTILDGWRGWYYALQRTLAELFLALRLIEHRLGMNTVAHGDKCS
jgi:glycosyltransferase involved in cell wall biosynthesis